MGPVVENCNGYVFPSPYIYKAAIYADENRVYGIRFLSRIDATDIGGLRGTPVLENFSPTEVPIGFYGSYTDNGITSLGFLTHDPNCSLIDSEDDLPPIERPDWDGIPEEEVEEPDNKDELIVDILTPPDTDTSDQSDGEGGSPVGMIIGIIVGVLALAAIIVVVIIFIRRRKRGQ